MFHEELQRYPIKMTIDPKSPVKSLDQLYMQAIVANAILLDKVRPIQPSATCFRVRGRKNRVACHLLIQPLP